MSTKTTRLIRFSIGFLLFMALCAAGILAGFRAGFDQGYASGKAKRQAEEPFPKVYRVGALIRATTVDQQPQATLGQPSQQHEILEFQWLIDATQTTVFPGEWEALGGPCTMVPVPTLEILVVNATSGVHDRLGEFLSDVTVAGEAIGAARAEGVERQAAQAAFLARVQESAAKHVGKDLTRFTANRPLQGLWRLEMVTSQSRSPFGSYEFVDNEKVVVTTSAALDQPVETWWFASPGSIVISGKSYLAFETDDGDLVLATAQDLDTVLVARQARKRDSGE